MSCGCEIQTVFLPGLLGGAVRTGNNYFFYLLQSNTMKSNMGTTDRTIRILAALALAGLYFSNQMSGLAAVIILVFAAVLFLTSYTGFCPLYLPFGWSTKKKSPLLK
jgi:hypothetical protein